MKIGFIGAGKAGTSLGAYFVKHGISVAGYFSRTMESSTRAARSTGSAAFSNTEDLCSACDAVFITTPDGEIENTAEKLGREGSAGNLFLVHVSGSLSSSVLASASEHIASAHPMTAISSYDTDFSGVFFTIEGEGKTAEMLKGLFESCGNRTARIRSEKKMLYHCAASCASNLMVGLADMAVSMLEECGFDEEDALLLLSPLMKGNMDAVCEKGPAEALTGPVERNDIGTVKGHLSSLEGREREIYRLLSLELIKTAREKNKERNYSKLETMLEELK